MKRLIKVIGALKAPKNQYNSFGRYNYRSLEDITEAVKPLLVENGLILIMKDEVELIGDRYYIKATATIYDSNGKLLAENSAYAREALQKKGMDESQITGATSSYARKYALNGLFCIDDNKDADTDEYQNQKKSQSNETTMKQNQNKKQKNKTCSQDARKKAIWIKFVEAVKEHSLGEITANELIECRQLKGAEAMKYASEITKDEDLFIDHITDCINKRYEQQNMQGE